MPRYTADFSKQDLEKGLIKELQRILKDNKVKSILKNTSNLSELNFKLKKDLSKIQADFSTVSIKNSALSEIVGFHETDLHHFLFNHEKDSVREEYKDATGKMQFLGCLAGSKEETSVFFLIYLNYDGTLRAYIPQKGNSFDKKLKKAMPIDKTKSLKEHFNIADMQEDIKKRIHYFSNDRLPFIPEAKF